jgi:hypothetical protein
MPSGTLPVTSDQDRKLVTAFRSPVTTAPFEATMAGSMFLACYFASLPHVDAARSDFGSATVSGLRRKTAVSLPQSRCSAFVRLVWLPMRSPLPSGIVTSLGIRAFNRLSGQSAHLPNSPDNLSLPVACLFLEFQLRIIVPGSLRFRRLAVPQTSWNLFQYDPESLWRQRPYGLLQTVFNNIYGPLFLIGYRGLAVKVLWIKHRRTVL